MRPLRSTTMTGLATPPGVLGVDISHYQCDIDFDMLVQAGVKFVIAKATEGLDMVDPWHNKFREAAAQRALPFGSYHFFDPTLDAAEQAKFYWKYASPKPNDILPILDSETDGPNMVHQSLAYAAYLKTIGGHWPILYTGMYLDRTRFNGWWPTAGLNWLADYDHAPSEPCCMWQFTESLLIGGLVRCDANVLVDTELSSIFIPIG